MKKFSLILIGFLLFFGACSDDSGGGDAPVDNEVRLRLDGVYVFEQPSLNYYLRFYEDNKVIYIASQQSPNEVAAWFNDEADNIGVGDYVVEELQIDFSISNSGIVVDYNGTVELNKLDLNSYNQNTGQSFGRVYEFEAVAF